MALGSFEHKCNGNIGGGGCGKQFLLTIIYLCSKWLNEIQQWMPLLHKSYSLIIPKLPHVQEFKMYVRDYTLSAPPHRLCISHLGGNYHLQFTTASSNMSPLFIIIAFISSTCITDSPTEQWPVTCLIHSSFTKPVHNSCVRSPVSMLTLTSWLQHADATLFSCKATLELMLSVHLHHYFK